jgi:hypothetical protein
VTLMSLSPNSTSALSCSSLTCALTACWHNETLKSLDVPAKADDARNVAAIAARAAFGILFVVFPYRVD